MIGTLRPLIAPSTPKEAVSAELDRKLALLEDSRATMYQLIREVHADARRKLHAKLVQINLDLGIPTPELELFDADSALHHTKGA